MKVLFIHSNQPDYLAESLFHGLRTLLGKNCVDVPRYDSMYAPLTDRIKSKLRGNGFTLYGLLEDIPELAEERYFWRKDLANYDLVVIGHIWWQWELVWKLLSLVDSEKIVILDGWDTPVIFPYTSGLINRPWSYLTPVSRFKYFKRELMEGGQHYGFAKFIPHCLRKQITLPQNVYPISFSIPDQKICKVSIKGKEKDFPKHIVDPEIAAQVNESFFSSIGSDRLFFVSEEDYYNDLKKSRFGITTKRGGWDCLRHYELAANGCVLCFKNIDLKPEKCAPHGLNDSNCITYHSFKELKEKLFYISPNDYCYLQNMSYKWIKNNTTKARARDFLAACNLPIR
ncbi:hypothetical protein MC7420_2255 [Coleofasciculus chthonoplastes PCC 7420]|uniref:Uncharacterized protein n=1 Tax=Coleofasciculus chthonoplastes PCC 7420 TaxID=118168 RepID=B4VS41_9CYAN|nr:hypothetical protein [Coleofasciculus chthonoplastes]EDX75251.1 hypothetical protein MC7420_2255 [Coleofasciculus chthonoplastes PCC 7420]